MQISREEMEAAKHCVEFAGKNGAEATRVSFSKSTLDTIAFLNGEVDKVTRCADRSIYIHIFAGGRYGGYSTNRLGKADLENFILKAIDNTKMLAEDPCRCLPEAERCAKNALTGRELALYDSTYERMTAAEKMEIAAAGTTFGKPKADIAGEDSTDAALLREDSAPAGYKVISEECEYSDSIDDNYVVDSQGFEGRHTETSFSYVTEITIEDIKGHKISGYHWNAALCLADLDIASCSPTALRKAVSQINPKPICGGKYTMVVESTSAPRLVAPLLSALSATAIQQNNSFLADSLGKDFFPTELRIVDFATTPGKAGSRLFDTEGVATKERDIISGGKVQMYFVNTYMSKKMGIEPTIEGSSRPTILPFIKAGRAAGTIPTSPEPPRGIDLQAILETCGEGILVTGFNGGNCNPTTGNFSYGVEGFVFKNGKITHPVKEMLITGNMLPLWNNLIAAGSDPNPGTRWQIPTLAFTDVDFSA